MSLSPPKARSRSDLFALIALACGGLVLMVVISSPYWHDVSVGHTDYLAFYAGGRLAFTPALYDEPQAKAQLSAAGQWSQGTYFIRMPWFAAAMWPLARLPYVASHWVWQGFLVSGLLIFAAFWPRPSLPVRAMILCYSLPAVMSLRMSQDVPLLVACMAVALVLLQRGKPVLGGLVLSLVLAKFHLFLPLFPVVLFARRWKFAAGLFSGTAILIATSFLVNGPDWPQRFLTQLSNPLITPRVITMPSFYYLIQGSPAMRNLMLAILGILLMILYFRIARISDEFLIAAAPVVMLPLLPHAGAYDCLLLAPLAMTALEAGSRGAKIAGALLLIPVTYFIAWSLSSGAMLIPILDVALLALCGMAPRPAKAAAVNLDGQQIASTG